MRCSCATPPARHAGPRRSRTRRKPGSPPCAPAASPGLRGEGMQRHDGADACLLYMPVHGQDRTLGYGGVREAGLGADVPGAWDLLAETLEDIGAGIADECRVQGELDTMALELSDRYEELHLVYAIDKQVQHWTPAPTCSSNLLQSWAEHMNADVAAFVKPGENLCVHATNLSAPIHNLDLVLVEMRGDLYRFAHSARAADRHQRQVTTRAAPTSSPTCPSRCCAAR
jgi:hypothetical protein